MSDSVLGELLLDYDKKRTKAFVDSAERKAKLYENIPELADLDKELNQFSISIAKSILSDNSDGNELENLKNKLEELRQKKIVLLKANNIEENYLLPVFECKFCKDTGYIIKDGKSEPCSCLKQKLFNLKFNQANIGNLDKENFKFFNMNLYSDEPNPEKYNCPISPRENIGIIKSSALKFIENFNNSNEKNLLFCGATGLGKTFLSNCIAYELINQGKTVLYQSAPVMLDNIINEIFNKNSTTKLLDSILNADLLIIDDLGTETMNSMKFTELYKIINTRLLNQNNKITKTIISTNLDLKGLFNTYDERLVSRFIGHYNIFKFFGDDIRFKK